jgi:7-keto-8-aminopelargonate synthetase-like enzyme
VDGDHVIGFCSNDYLGYASSLASSTTEAQPSLSGAGASRLICGDLEPHREVERALASVARTEDAVLFVSGFQLNVGVLPAILRGGDNVYSDRLIHASMIDGLRLSAPRPSIVPHLETPPLSQSPPTIADDERASIRWWICESLYSMNGTRHDPDQHKRWLEAGHALYLDGAHDFGLYEDGAGWSQANNISPDLYVGTLGKAYGAAGAFVASTGPICDLIRNTARSFVFSTALSPVVATQLLQRIKQVRGGDGDERRARLTRNILRMSQRLELPVQSAIVPLAVGDPNLAMSLSKQLRANGWHVQAIRPPTVPHGSSRLRLTISAAHTEAQIDALTAELARVFAQANHPLELAAAP